MALTTASPLRQVLIYTSTLFLLFFTGCSRTAPELIEEGKRQVRDGKYGEAVLTYRKALQKEPKSADGHFQMGQALWKMKNGDAAWDAFAQAAAFGERSPELIKAQLEVAVTALLAAPSYPEPLRNRVNEFADKALAADKNSFEGLRAKAYVELTAGDQAASLEWFRKAYAARPDDREVQVSLVQSLYRNGLWQESVAFGDSVLMKNPKLSAIYNVLFQLHLAGGRSAMALELANRRLVANPDDADAYLQIARYWAAMGNRQQEQAAVERLVTIKTVIVPNAFLEAGQYELSRKRPLEAAKLFAEGAKSSKKSGFLRALEAAALADAGKLQEAESAYLGLIKANASDGESMVNLAIVQMAMGKPEKLQEARSGLQAALTKFPQLPRARFQLGRVYQLQNDLASAVREWKAIPKESPDCTSASLELAKNALASGQYKEALEYSRSALAADRGFSAASMTMAESLQGLGKLDEAEPLLERLLTSAPQYRRTIELNLAIIALARNRVGRAQALLQGMSKGSDKDPRWIEASAKLLLAEKQIPQAIALLKKAVQENGDSGLFRLILAKSALQAGQFQLASEQYDWLTKQSPKDVKLLLSHAEAIFLAGKPEAAVELARKACQLEASNHAAHASLGFLLQASGRHEQAVEVFTRAVAIEPKSGADWNNIAWSNARLLSLDPARKAALKAIELNAQNLDFRDTLAWIVMLSGDHSKAIQMFRDLTTSQPENPGFHFHLAEALLRSGDAAAAKASIQLGQSRKGKVPEECEFVMRVSTRTPNLR